MVRAGHCPDVLSHPEDGHDGVSHGVVALPDDEAPDVHLKLELRLVREGPAICGEQDIVDLGGQAGQQ